MNTENTSKQQIDEIRSLMERSSRFISLSGLSGISAGIIALIGAIFAFFYLDFDIRYFDINRFFAEKHSIIFQRELIVLLIDAAIVLFLAVASAIFFTTRRAKRKGLKVWTPTTRLMLYNITVPLLTGGLFCAILLNYNLIFLIAPTTLIFYGLALLNGSKYTLPEIQWLGISEIILGLISCIFPGYAILFWSVGFGLLHIIYGMSMYYRYESDDSKSK